MSSALHDLRELSMDSPEALSLQAELAAARAQEKPCYFNGGCCSFSDGQVTGMEIAEGQIRLVQWMMREGKASRAILDSADLAEVFEKSKSRAAPIMLDSAQDSGR